MAAQGAVIRTAGVYRFFEAASRIACSLQPTGRSPLSQSTGSRRGAQDSRTGACANRGVQKGL
jgi:hypothetical protein